MSVWLREELVGSRLSPDEPLPDAIRWIDLDEALRAGGGRCAPGETSLPASFVATLARWRLAGARPLIARVLVPTGADLERTRTAVLEIDALSGGACDAIAIEERPEAGPPDAATPPTGSVADARAASAPRTRDPAVLRRIEGSLLGLAAGDSLGAPVENWPADKIARVHGPFRDFVSGRGWGPGYPTRETTFALLWFREIASGRTVHLARDRDRLGQALARWVVGRPRDFGHLTRGILSGYIEDPPVVAARKAFDRAHRRTEFNGALSRAAAVGAALAFETDLRWTSAIAASAMTYPAAVCLGSAIAVAEGVAAAVRGDSDPLDAARACAWDERTAAALEEVARGEWEPGRGNWAGHERGHVLRTLQSAFWAISRPAASLEGILLDLVHRGGDADTHAAIAGALLGARQGPDAIPARWRDRLRVRALIASLVERFAAAPQADSGSPGPIEPCDPA